MIRKLTAKIQNISASLPQSAGAFSGVLIINPDDTAVLERKGTVYAVFHITGSQEFDVNLVSKVVHDVLHDSYYQSDNVSPVQSLEKAIVEVRDRVTKLTNESIRSNEGNVDFNMVAGVLWGNVIYVVQYGKSGGFLMRDGNIKAINANTEGHFSAASGVVKEDDVVLFATLPFMQKVSPDKLLSTDIDQASLPPDASCLVLKFAIDTTFTETEVVDFPMPREGKGLNLNFAAKSLFSKSLKKGSKQQAQAPQGLPEQVPEARPPVSPDINTISQMVPEPQPSAPRSGTGIKLKKDRSGKFKPNRTIIIAVVGILLLVSIGYTVKSNFGKNSANEPNIEVLSTNIDSPPALQTEETPGEPAVVDETVFYDLKLADASANPGSIAILEDKVVVADHSTGKIYQSDISTPKFTQIEKTFMGISALENADGDLGVTDSEGYKVVDLATNEVTPTIKITTPGVMATYLGNVYVLSGDTLTKYTSDGTSSTWAQSSEMEGAGSMAISVSIYVLKKDGTLLSYTTGAKDNFSVSGLETALANPVQIQTNYDFDNMYIADAGNRRIVVLDKKGTFIKEVKHENPLAWGNMKGIGVSADETKLYVLDGSKVHEIDLK
ncbi:MAG: hypothetical protein UU72_C0009G0025 [candidate division WWE3 bacterium GW2011_GWB1_41_6]|uniref:Uncharacterized protein n=1 Tax=candidate division WWE3 bacterium GW2011_GWB1_41_6 TaxID=1619112 RepID=A0A0G0ZV61_UNCKA|nr:MAG: hypothetical protein UU72_C0009G0025 [candidate division WWE3 bacterium GW2011_GWB1_41_6]